MKPIAILSFLFTTCFSTLGFGSDVQCKNVNLRMGPTLNYVRNQKSLGWCYAYSLSDLIGHRLGKKVSPFDLALGLYRSYEEYGLDSVAQATDLAGGRVSLTFKAAQSRGVCLESKVSASGDLSARMLYKVDDLADQIAKIDRRATNYAMQVQRLVYQNSFALHRVFPTSTMAELVDAFLNLKDGAKPLISVVDNICGERTPIDSMKLKIAKEGPNVVATLKRILAKGTPLTIGYSSDTLKDIKFRGPVSHASTVIGMRKNRAGECEFLIRNSWGGMNSKQYDPAVRQNFLQGTFWVPESLMKEMAHQVHYLEPMQ